MLNVAELKISSLSADLRISRKCSPFYLTFFFAFSYWLLPLSPLSTPSFQPTAQSSEKSEQVKQACLRECQKNQPLYVTDYTRHTLKQRGDTYYHYHYT